MAEIARPQPARLWPFPGIGYERAAIALIVALTVARFVLAPFIPLAFDEAYYWRWSTHLAFGYLDHPPMIAWMIRLGTALFGTTEFGVRVVGLVGSIGATWAVWRAAELLFEDRRLAATAALFFNLTLIVSVGTILATPDTPLLLASAFLLYCLAKVAKGGGPRWWLAAGVVTGLGCLGKYTALFWLPSILLWLILDPRMRPQLRSPWPWIGAALALLIFMPNVVWNATHDWMTFAKQFGRVRADAFTPQYLVEHIGTEIGMATPIVFVLGWVALGGFLFRHGAPQTARILLGALVWPTSLYFVYHSVHAEVEGNWTGPIFPAFSVAAAATLSGNWPRRTARFIRALRPAAVPVGLVLNVAIYLQALFGFLPLGASDPTASRIGAGMADIGAQVDRIRQSEGATLVFTPDYALTGWLSFYSPTQPAPVREAAEPERWIQEPPPTSADLNGPFIFILPADTEGPSMDTAYGTAVRLTTITRSRGDLVIERYDIYVVQRHALA